METLHYLTDLPGFSSSVGSPAAIPGSVPGYSPDHWRPIQTLANRELSAPTRKPRRSWSRKLSRSHLWGSRDAHGNFLV